MERQTGSWRGTPGLFQVTLQSGSLRYTDCSRASALLLSALPLYLPGKRNISMRTLSFSSTRHALTLTHCRTTLIALVASVVISGCASSGSSLSGTPGAAGNNSRITACKSTDTQVSSSNQCLQDDAACYQISNGQWCTGERGNVCPAGSTALSAGMACPIGKRCFRVGESLECAIN